MADETLAGAVDARSVPDDADLAVLLAWVPRQRWFPAKGSPIDLVRVAAIDLPDPLAEAEVRVHLLAMPSGMVLQVPTVLRPGPVSAGEIGEVPGGTLVDGPHDAAFVRAWLAAARHDGALPTPPGPHRVSGGEQSNTSVLLPDADPPAILKVFRAVTVGANPDVAVPLALSHAGWRGVPRPLAWLPGRWPTPDGVTVVGHLGVLSQLVLGARDGFDLACEYAREGRDFGDLAADLGRTTAQLHRALRTALPSTETHGPRPPVERAQQVRRVVRTLRERAAVALERVPDLATRASAIEAAYVVLDQLTTVPPLQRVHGDYHLGQVLRSGDDHWYVLDFEGEPQASATEKNRPDLALRDLAGMLRSLDYAAAVGGAADPAWLSSARARLTAAYHEENQGSGDDPTAALLLPALELDKALYEAVYESGNRPSWLPIPLGAVDRLLARNP